jgi:hypothetical protein
VIFRCLEELLVGEVGGVEGHGGLKWSLVPKLVFLTIAVFGEGFTSFAKLVFTLGSFANVPPNAWAYSVVVNCLPANVPYAFPDTSPRL